MLQHRPSPLPCLQGELCACQHYDTPASVAPPLAALVGAAGQGRVGEQAGRGGQGAWCKVACGFHCAPRCSWLMPQQEQQEAAAAAHRTTRQPKMAQQASSAGSSTDAKQMLRMGMVLLSR